MTEKHLWSVGSGYEVNPNVLVKISPSEMAGRVKAKIQVSTFSRQGLESEISEVDSHSFSALLPKYGNEKMRRLIGWLKMTDIINFTSLHTSIFEIVF